MPHVPGVDGLRAIAALSVVLFHFSYGQVPGGFLGVDIFFAISGFLITSTLLADIQQTQQFRFGAFYVRRARRLLPALAATLVLAFLVWPRDAPPYSDAARATLLYYANWRMVLEGSGSLGPLGHSWSLSIEEQFYLLWPWTLGGILSISGSRRTVAWLTLALVALLAGMRALAAANGSILAAYESTLARMDELLLGSAFALIPLPSGPQPSSALSRWVGILAIPPYLLLLFVADSHDRWLYLGGFTLVALVAAAVVRDLVLRPFSMLSRLLSWKPLAELGKRSYGVYLYHWPLMMGLERLRRHGAVNFAAVTLLRLSATLAIAWLSYRFIEEPFLRSGRRRLGPQRAVVAQQTTNSEKPCE